MTAEKMEKIEDAGKPAEGDEKKAGSVVSLDAFRKKHIEDQGSFLFHMGVPSAEIVNFASSRRSRPAPILRS